MKFTDEIKSYAVALTVWLLILVGIISLVEYGRHLKSVSLQKTGVEKRIDLFQNGPEETVKATNGSIYYKTPDGVDPRKEFLPSNDPRNDIGDYPTNRPVFKIGKHYSPSEYYLSFSDHGEPIHSTVLMVLHFKHSLEHRATNFFYCHIYQNGLTNIIAHRKPIVSQVQSNQWKIEFE